MAWPCGIADNFMHYRDTGFTSTILADPTGDADCVRPRLNGDAKFTVPV